MKRLWAPWRIGYVSGKKKPKGCLFCAMTKGRRDEKNYVVLRTPLSFAVLNLFPYNNGHVMIVPKRHVRSLDLLSEQELMDLLRCLKMAQANLKRILKPHGFNIGINEGAMAGAGIDKHLHIHLVPRWKGDVNFMPVLSSTKIISQSLDALYKAFTSCR